MRKNQKGFTLVELLVVIAILAILATVAVVGYTSFIESANESNDKALVGQMNTFLQANEMLEYDSIFDLYDGLAEGGVKSDNYTPNVKGRFFFWDRELNRVLYTDEEYNVIFPTQYKDRENTYWFSLDGRINEKEVDYSTGAVTINTPEELYYLGKQLKANGYTGDLTITIGADINLMGANVALGTVLTGKTLTIDGNSKSISNLFVNSFIQESDGSGNSTSGSAATYGCGFINKNEGTLTIKDLTFEHSISDMNAKGDKLTTTGSSQVAIVVGINTGTVTLTNVNITDSVVKGYTKTGTLIGHNAGQATLDHCALERNTIIAEPDGTDTISDFAAVIVGYCPENSLNIMNGIKLVDNTTKIADSNDQSRIKIGEGGIPYYIGRDGTTIYYMTCNTCIIGAYNYNSADSILTLGTPDADGYADPTISTK